MRGMANPIPALEPGGIEQNEWDPGGDVLLPDDHFGRLHNPANGRVPPQLPSPVSHPKYPNFPPTQYERFFTITPAGLDRQLGFNAMSVRVDNYSSHWVYLPSAGMYIPPFIYGTVLWLNPGSNVAFWIVGAPIGHTDSASLESLVVSIWYESEQVPVTGFSVPAT
jgi:hypothetical protein